jgi:hypothetical protein
MQHTLLIGAAIWIAVALVIWLWFYYKYANKPTELYLPPLLIIASIVFWPITIVAAILFGLWTLIAWIWVSRKRTNVF